MKNNNNLIEFFETIKKDKHHRNLNTQEDFDAGAEFETWDFQVVTKMFIPGRVNIDNPGRYDHIVCIILDAEDMEYLTKKYKPGLEEELNEKKRKLEFKYGNL